MDTDVGVDPTEVQGLRAIRKRKDYAQGLRTRTKHNTEAEGHKHKDTSTRTPDGPVPVVSAGLVGLCGTTLAESE